jgi:hypothetical protein
MRALGTGDNPNSDAKRTLSAAALRETSTSGLPTLKPFPINAYWPGE